MIESERVKTQSEKEQFVDRLQTLVRSVSHNTSLRVTTTLDPNIEMQLRVQGEDPKKSWFYDTAGNYVYLPPEMFVISENEAKGKAAHEASHVVITRIQKIVPKEVFKELGLTPLIMALEERPTDEYVRKYTVGAGEWLDDARMGSMTESETAVKESKRDRRKKQPKFFQLCNLIVYGRFANRLKPFVDRDVWEMYHSQLEEEVRNVEQALPSYQGSEEEVMEKASERYSRTYNNIWPIAKKLVEEDKEFQEIKEMLKIQEALDDLVKRINEELMNELDQILSGEKSSSGDPEEGSLEDMDQSQISKELRQALKESFERLPKDVQQTIRERAQQKLQKIESEFTKKHESKLTAKVQPNSADENQQPEISQKGEPSDSKKTTHAKRISEVMEKAETISASSSERSNSKYDQAYRRVSPYIERLYKRLEEIFHPNVKKLAQLRSGGSKININAVFKRESQRSGGARNIDNKIFEVTHFPEPRDYAVTLLVDLSGSMCNEQKIQNAFEGTVMLAEVLNRLGIKIEVLGFQDEVIVFKDFATELTDTIRNKISGMIGEVVNNNPGGHNNSGFNDDAPCLLLASKRLAEHSAKQRKLIIISDGLPSGKHSNEEDLVSAVNHINNQTDQILIGLGLGFGTGHVERFYGKNSLPNIRPEELPEKLGNLLYDIIHGTGQEK